MTRAALVMRVHSDEYKHDWYIDENCAGPASVSRQKFWLLQLNGPFILGIRM